MNLFECRINASLCPLEYQSKVLTLTTENFQALGITSESLTQSVMLVFGIVMILGLSGYAVGVVKQVIKQL